MQLNNRVREGTLLHSETCNTRSRPGRTKASHLPFHVSVSCMRVIRTALLALLSVASCCAFQAPLFQGDSLALRGPQDPRRLQSRGATDDTLREKTHKTFVAESHKTPVHIQYDVSEVRSRMWQIPRLVNSKPIILKSSTFSTQAPTRARRAIAVFLAGLGLARAIPGGGNVLANFAAGAVGGIVSLFARPGEAMVSGPWAEKIAAHSMVKGISAGCYSALMAIATACTVGASCAGLAGVAFASLGTGLVVGLCCKGLERAETIGERVSLLNKLQSKASNGFFTQDGLFGEKMGGDLAESVVQHEAFFLSYALLCIAFPWMGSSFATTAVFGGISGVIMSASGAVFKCVNSISSNISEFSRQCKDWWCGLGQRNSATAVVDACTGTAVKSAAFLIGYKAACDTLMMAA